MRPFPTMKSSCVAAPAVIISSVTDTSASASMRETPKRFSSYRSFSGDIKALAVLLGAYLTFSIKVF